jgi:hypothetical protein
MEMSGQLHAPAALPPVKELLYSLDKQIIKIIYYT